MTRIIKVTSIVACQNGNVIKDLSVDTVNQGMSNVASKREYRPKTLSSIDRKLSQEFAFLKTNCLFELISNWAKNRTEPGI